MLLNDFTDWLNERYTPGTVSTRISNVKKIEEYYGNLDEHFSNGTYLKDIINTLEYSTKDKSEDKKNPSKIQFNGDIKNNLNMYKNAANLYLSFLEGRCDQVGIRTISTENTNLITSNQDATRQKMGVERDMQVALRRNILSLDPTLKIIDNGLERAVDSGFIDITCEDSNGLVVVELKADKADSRAIGQILGYMGDLMEESDGKKVRGILVAYDFDKRAKAAARVVPTLTLKKYHIEFQFIEED
jgi:hypothetical protein